MLNTNAQDGSRLSQTVRRISAGLGGFAFVGGSVTLAGWALDYQALTDWEQNGISMLVNPAIAAACAGFALLLLGLGKPRIAQGLAVIVFLVGAATLLEHLVDIDLGIDSLILQRSWGQRATTAPGRMGPPASLSFTLLGLGLMLAGTSPGGLPRGIASGLGIVVAIIVLPALIGYLFGADSLFAVPRLTGISFQATLIIVALGIGLTASIVEWQPVRTLAEEGAAGMMARRSLIIIVTLPLLLGWLRMRAQDMGLVDTPMGAGLLVLSLILLMSAGLWWSVSAVSRHEAERANAEAELQKLNTSLAARIAEATSAIEERAVQLRALAVELTQAEQRERRRLAGVLHDGLQQVLVAAQLHLGALRPGSVHQAGIDRVASLIEQCVQQARTLAVDLCPPLLHDSGLIAALDWLRRQFDDQHGLKLHVETEPEAEPAEVSRREFIFQAIRELVFNVTKHANVKEAWVCLRRPTPDVIEAVVRDDGVGCDPSLVETNTGEHFGLFSIRERLQLLGGAMRIRCAVGQGMSVTLCVPDPPCTSEPSSAFGQDSFSRNGELSHEPQRIRVLLADDHVVVREGLLTVLEGHKDIEVIGQACDGVEAVELALILQPHVVLMDVSMPRLNGIEATRRLTKAAPHVSVIGLSMHEGRDMASAMLAAGAVAYHCKAEPAAKLIDAIREAGNRVEAAAN